MGKFRPLFVYFRYFLATISIIEKSVDEVLGIRTRGRRMVGANKTTELWLCFKLIRKLKFNLKVFDFLFLLLNTSFFSLLVKNSLSALKFDFICLS